jgi:photosystem II stability/assembly factor-like uncharacterized protein
MKKIFVVAICFFALYSCKTVVPTFKDTDEITFNSISIDTLFQDKISIRAISIDGNKIWYAANNSKYGFFDLDTNKKTERKIFKDSSNFEFRSIAQTDQNIFLLSVANPALLYKISKENGNSELVYQEHHEKVFYDSMQFWNNKEGIAMGDPIGNCLSVIITRDGGNSWRKVSCASLPVNEDGEAAFAASNTNIVIKGNNTWIVTGGQKARVLFSSDKGLSWQIYNTPIVQGKAMAGIFTADFYDSNVGFISGGDYEALQQNFGNKARTIDGGKTWQLVAENQGFGYASCVQYFPNSNGKSLISVGASGIYYSHNGGSSWKLLAKDTDLYTLRFTDYNTAVAAGRNKMIQIKFLK